MDVAVDLMDSVLLAACCLLPSRSSRLWSQLEYVGASSLILLLADAPSLRMATSSKPQDRPWDGPISIVVDLSLCRRRTGAVLSHPTAEPILAEAGATRLPCFSCLLVTDWGHLGCWSVIAMW